MTTLLADGLWRIRGRASNVYLVRDGSDLVLVDAGTPGDVGRIRRGVTNAGYRLSDVSRVLVTHYDFDHVGALSRLDLDATVYAHPHAAALMTGERTPPLTNHKGLLQRAAGHFLSPVPSVDPVADGDDVGGFTAFHTPGHTPGHTVYVSEEADVVFLGDLVAGSNGGLAASTWLMSYDVSRVRESIETLRTRLPPVEWGCPGHGDPVMDPGERLRSIPLD